MSKLQKENLFTRTTFKALSQRWDNFDLLRTTNSLIRIIFTVCCCYWMQAPFRLRSRCIRFTFFQSIWVNHTYFLLQSNNFNAFYFVWFFSLISFFSSIFFFLLSSILSLYQFNLHFNQFFSSVQIRWLVLDLIRLCIVGVFVLSFTVSTGSVTVFGFVICSLNGCLLLCCYWEPCAWQNKARRWHNFMLYIQRTMWYLPVFLNVCDSVDINLSLVRDLLGADFFERKRYVSI